MTWTIAELIENFEKDCKKKHNIELTHNNKKFLDNVLCGVRDTSRVGERQSFILDLYADYTNERNKTSFKKRQIRVSMVSQKRKS